MVRKITVFSTYPPVDASTRLRILPLARRLRSEGWDVRLSILLPSWAYLRKNSGKIWKAVIALFLIPRLLLRLVEVGLVSEQAVLIHRELFPFFTPRVEMWLRRHVDVFLVDVDDAIYVTPTHARDWRSIARKPANAIEYLRRADIVFSGSPVEGDRLRANGVPHVAFIPTCPDPTVLQLATTRPRNRAIAWTGSQSTLASLQAVLEPLLRFCTENEYTLHALGGKNIASLPRHPRLLHSEWTPERELHLLTHARFGVMPIPDTDWERGKSSYKALLYMAAGIIPIVSPVGMNEWLAEQCSAVVCVNNDDWYKALSDLVDDTGYSDKCQEAQTWALENANSRLVSEYQVKAIEQLAYDGQ
jgi:hypothetical protein